MHFVGKILVVLQVVLSLMFMAFAGAVYTYQTNWRNEANQVQQRLTESQQALNDAETSHDAYVAETDASLKRQQDRADTFEARASNLQQELDDAREQLETARTELENAQALAAIAGEEAQMRRDEAISLREIIGNLHTSREELVANNRSLEDKLFSNELIRQQYADRYERLQNEHAVYKQVVQANDIDVETYVAETTPPPEVKGRVMMRKERRNAPDLVQISIGSDDGLARGHELYVYRMTGKGKFLGKIRIDYVDPDVAVGTVIDRAKNGIIQRGDNVTTKL